MDTEIYYFTATGNSLAVARDLAARMQATLLPIPALLGRPHMESDAEVVGLVFPVYYANLGGSGIPFLVARFVEKWHSFANKYIFAVCTHGGGPVATMGNLGKLIAARGGELSAGYTVKMGYSPKASAKLKHALFHQELQIDPRRETEERQKLFDGWKQKLETIYATVSARQKGEIETPGPVASLLLPPFLALQNRMGIARYQKLAGATGHTFDELVPLADKSFRVNDRCTGCGTCARVCPVRNIELVNRKPVWQHRCETCYACFQWCPQEAIGGDIVEYEKRYHHPEVTLADMLRATA